MPPTQTGGSAGRSLSRAEARDYDRRAIAAGIPGIVLMENAGRGVAELLVSLRISGPVGIVCGKGNNAGDGFVIARHLMDMGFSPQVFLVSVPRELTGDAKVAFAPLARLGIPVHAVTDDLAARLAACAWAVDALLGTGTQGDIRPPFAAAIECINQCGRPVLAVDLPSGLDCDTGLPLGLIVRATHTATFVARKLGFDNPASVPFTGHVHVLSIGAGLPL